MWLAFRHIKFQSLFYWNAVLKITNNIVYAKFHHVSILVLLECGLKDSQLISIIRFTFQFQSLFYWNAVLKSSEYNLI